MAEEGRCFDSVMDSQINSGAARRSRYRQYACRPSGRYAPVQTSAATTLMRLAAIKRSPLHKNGVSVRYRASREGVIIAAFLPLFGVFLGGGFSHGTALSEILMKSPCFVLGEDEKRPQENPKTPRNR